MTHLMPVSPHDTAPKRSVQRPTSWPRKEHSAVVHRAAAMPWAINSRPACTQRWQKGPGKQVAQDRQFPSAGPKLTHQTSYRKSKYQFMLLSSDWAAVINRVINCGLLQTIVWWYKDKPQIKTTTALHSDKSGYKHIAQRYTNNIPYLFPNTISSKQGFL